MRVVQLTGRHLCQAFLGAPEQAGGREGRFTKGPLLEFLYHKDLGLCSATIDHAF